MLSSIPELFIAKASFQGKAYARALLHYEKHIKQERMTGKDDQEMYNFLQEIYSCLDEPDGMEGISTKLIQPTLEQQIREHESAGRWTAAQTCYEMSLQRDPTNIQNHIGLLKCWKQLGHFETLITHVEGLKVVKVSPESSLLKSLGAEAAWRLGNWSKLEEYIEVTEFNR